MEFDILGIKKLKRDIMGLQVGFDDLRYKLAEANVHIERLTEKVESLERINLYGRGDEPEVIVENSHGVIIRLYIDGEEFTIKNPDGLYATWFQPIIKKSIMVDGDIATVVIQQAKEYEDIYHIEYNKGAYVHQVRRIPNIVRDREEQ